MSVEMASLEVQRIFGRWTDRLRRYEVVIDGVIVGRLANGESSVFEVPVGAHDVFLKIDWCRSEKVALDLVVGQKAILRCRGRNPLAALYWITFGRRRYVKMIQLVV